MAEQERKKISKRQAEELKRQRITALDSDDVSNMEITDQILQTLKKFQLVLRNPLPFRRQAAKSPHCK